MDHQTATYRVALLLSGSVLTEETAEGYRLPHLCILRWRRLAQQLRQAIQATFNLEVVILDYLVEDTSSTPCVVAEVLDPGSHPALKSIGVNDISVQELSEPERRQLASILDGHARNPTCSAGWIKAASAWAERVSGAALASVHPFEQYNAGRGFALLRFRAENGTAYWLKATGAPNTHERAVTEVLAELCSGLVPRVLDSSVEWNAWLMAEETRGSDDLPLESCAAVRFLESAAQSMAELQVKTIGHTCRILKAGAFDQSLTAFAAQSATLFSYIDEAMSVQLSTKVPRIERQRVQEIHDVFNLACERLDEIGLPESVLHGDMNVGNIMVGSSRCQFIDWAETYIGNPLITLQHMLLLNQAENLYERARVDALVKAKYRGVLSQVCDPAAIDEASIYMPLIAAYAALYGRGDWTNTDVRNAAHRQGYARNIARYMDRAAKDPILLRSLEMPCSNTARSCGRSVRRFGDEVSREWSNV